MKCRACGSELDNRKPKSQSFFSDNSYIKCSVCGALNHIKRRRKTGQIRKIVVVQTVVARALN